MCVCACLMSLATATSTRLAQKLVAKKRLTAAATHVRTFSLHFTLATSHLPQVSECVLFLLFLLLLALYGNAANGIQLTGLQLANFGLSDCLTV